MSGLFGVVSLSDCTRTLFYGTDYHSHLGTEVAGLATLDGHFRHRIHSIADTQFKSRFAAHLAEMPGRSGIGVISDSNTQPFIVSAKVGDFAIVTAGLITNKDDLAEKLLEAGQSFSEVARGEINPSELVAKIISSGKSIADGIRLVFDQIEGSCTMLLLTRDGIFAARDARGRLPLVLGRREGSYAVATESSAFVNLGYELMRFVQPGEIVHITAKGAESVWKGSRKRQVCSFMWVYTGYPASAYEGISVEAVRERTGAALAAKDDLKADIVAGVPDSGTGHAIGYAIASGLPFRRPLVKYTPGYGRSYAPPSQEIRDLVAEMKLIPIVDIIRGKRIVLCEDSIVRGTQLKNLTVKKLRDSGAREIHLRAACPPLMFPCIYAVSTRSLDELAARRAIKALEGHEIDDVAEYVDPTTQKHTHMVQWIRDDIGVTTLRYLELDEMISAIGLDADDLCTYCWRGRND